MVQGLYIKIWVATTTGIKNFRIPINIIASVCLEQSSSSFRQIFYFLGDGDESGSMFGSTPRTPYFNRGLYNIQNAFLQK